MPRLSRFATPYGSEAFVTAEMAGGDNAEKDVLTLIGEYSSFLDEHALNADSEVFIRFHLRDLRSESGVLKRILEKRGVPSFYSLVGQPPSGGGRIAIEAYHIKSAGAVIKSKVSENELILDHGGYRSLWMRSGPTGAGPCGRQTREMFESLAAKLGERGALVKDSVIRTWCFIGDIHKNYASFVKARKEFFSSLGMTGETHTPASTGIGALNDGGGPVVMDSLSVLGLEPAQRDHMSVPEYMSPPYAYDVTFERGTKIVYGDRTHYYVSGTASIDTQGNALYPDDAEKQALKALENIRALLNAYEADLADMKMMVVYLQDRGEYPSIRGLLREVLPEKLPYIVVRGSVCRTSWLVEMEGIAVSEARNERFRPFC